jgi:hypothetical protein
MTQWSLSRSIPSLSYSTPPESDSVIGFAPKSSSFSTVYWATLPEPDTRHTLPSSVSPRVWSICSAKYNRAVPGGLGPDQRTAPVQPLPVSEPVNSFRIRLYWPNR